MRTIMVILVVLAGLVVCPSCSRREAPARELVFDGNSLELKTTRIAATLEAPIERGMNVVWCASFLSAWKAMESDLVKGPVSLEGSPALASALNEAADPRVQIPNEVLYVATGWNQKGIVDEIGKDLAKRFPAKAPPAFPGILPDSFVAYAYMEACQKFSIPYFQNDRPLVFTDAAGTTTELSSFGIRPGDDDYAYRKLHEQPVVLHVTMDEGSFEKCSECIIDLDRTSRPNQIVIAMVEPKGTLAKTLADVEQKITAASRRRGRSGLNPDVLLVPDIAYRITHRFAELEGRSFLDAGMQGQRMDVARQDTEFRLDRSGVELKSEAESHASSIPVYYVFDRPFLLYMKKRGAEAPYFVMWVDNAELLAGWQASEAKD